MKQNILVLAAILISSLSVKSQIVNIPDANFKAYLVNNPAINTGGGPEIEVSEAQAFTGPMNCYNLGITNLTGIEAFTSLTTLKCYDNPLMGFNLSSNTSLSFLDCTNCQLTSLNLSANTNLTELYCYNNLLTSLDLSANTLLTHLYCYENNITSLDFSNNPGLVALDCFGNQLTYLNLASGNNTALSYIDAGANPGLTCVYVDNAAYSTNSWDVFPYQFPPVTQFYDVVPVVNISGPGTVCSGNSITLTASGGSSYSWSTGETSASISVSPAITTTYTVSSTQPNGCRANNSKIVTVSAAPGVNAGTDQTVCAGTQLTLNGSGAVSYTWNNGVTNNTPFTPAVGTTTYTVTGTDANNCTNTDQVNITVNALPNTNTTLTGITITATQAGAAYQWINCTTNAPIAGQTAQNFTATINGSYAVIVTNNNNCSDTSACVIINTVGLQENLLSDQVEIYPNPGTGIFHIKTSGFEPTSVKITNAVGALICDTVYSSNMTIDLSSNPNGVYFVILELDQQQIMTRIVKE